MLIWESFERRVRDDGAVSDECVDSTPTEKLIGLDFAGESPV